MEKSTVQEIKERFDNDVERFSNLQTGQSTTLDAALSLELICEAAHRIVPKAKEVLDIGCGAGNYTLKMLSKNPNLNCTMVDLSQPMLNRAFERISEQSTNKVTTIQGDIREVDLEEGKYDIILAGAVLHHLRNDTDWENTFDKLYKLLKPGGCLMISDLVSQDNEVLQEYVMEKYGDFIESLGGKEYRKTVLDYIEKEDTPKSVNYQLQLMKKVGFRQTDVLHKNLCCAAFGGIK